MEYPIIISVKKKKPTLLPVVAESSPTLQVKLVLENMASMTTRKFKYIVIFLKRILLVKHLGKKYITPYHSASIQQ